MTYEFYTVDPKKRDYTNYFTDEFFSDLIYWDEAGKFRLRNYQNIIMNDFYVREDVLWNITQSNLSDITSKLKRCFPRGNQKKFLNFFNKCQISNANKSDKENSYAIFKIDDYLVILCKEDYFGPLFIICEVYKISEHIKYGRMIKELDYEIKVRTVNKD